MPRRFVPAFEKRSVQAQLFVAMALSTNMCILTILAS